MLDQDHSPSSLGLSSTVTSAPTTTLASQKLNSSGIVSAADVIVGNVSTAAPPSPLFNATQTGGVFSQVNPGALYRGSIVFGVLCVLVVLYIALRTCRLRRHRQSARYNVLATHDEAVPLHSDDDEETVFDAAGPRR